MANGRKRRLAGCPKRWRRGDYIRNGHQGSRVYRCLDIDSARLLTVEQVPAVSLGSLEHAQLFVSKMNYLSQLQHPNLVRIVGGQLGIPKPVQGEDNPDSPPKLNLEQVVVNIFQSLPRGTLLVDALAQGTLGLEDCRHLAMQLSHCIGYLHHNGVVHSNIHPQLVTAAISQSFLLAGLKGAKFESEHEEQVWKQLLGGDVWDLGCLLLSCVLGPDAYDKCMQAVGHGYGSTVSDEIIQLVKNMVHNKLKRVTSCENIEAFFRMCFLKCFEDDAEAVDIQSLLHSAWITMGTTVQDETVLSEPNTIQSSISLPQTTNSVALPSTLGNTQQSHTPKVGSVVTSSTALPSINGAQGNDMQLLPTIATQQEIKQQQLEESQQQQQQSTAPIGTSSAASPSQVQKLAQESTKPASSPTRKKKRNLGLKLEVLGDASNVSGPGATLVSDTSTPNTTQTKRPSSSHRKIDIESLLSKGGVVSFSNVKPGIVPSLATTPSSGVGLASLVGGIRSSTPSSVRLGSTRSTRLMQNLQGCKLGDSPVDQIQGAQEKRTAQQHKFLQSLQRTEGDNVPGSNRSMRRDNIPSRGQSRGHGFDALDDIPFASTKSIFSQQTQGSQDDQQTTMEGTVPSSLFRKPQTSLDRDRIGSMDHDRIGSTNSIERMDASRMRTPGEADHRNKMTHKINGIMNWVQSFEGDHATEENFKKAVAASKM